MNSDQRAHVVAVAHSWLGTPYHAMGRVKGAGVDCLTLLAEVYSEAGITREIPVSYYPPDWHLHRGQERYLEGLLHYTHEIESLPEPGDIALWKFGRCYSHGAIVVNWPVIIHAYVGRACLLEDVSSAQWLSSRPVKFFTLKPN